MADNNISVNKGADAEAHTVTARALASVQRIKSIEPLPDSDFLELARIKGWQCVVRNSPRLVANGDGSLH
jgi:hypothetical protein